MPKTITVPEHSYVVYTFDELDESAQDKAIDWFATDYPDYAWHESVYEDAENIGIKITEFDIDRGNNIAGKLLKSHKEIADKIIKDHGDTCESYKTAKAYLDDLKALELKHDIANKDEYVDDLTDFEDEKEELNNEFRKSILEDYLSSLKKEYEYLTSRECIIENIKANEYTFDEKGKRKD